MQIQGHRGQKNIKNGLSWGVIIVSEEVIY